VADYLRQSQCHMTQHSFDVRWSAKAGGTVVDRRVVTSTDREFNVAEMDAAFARVFDAHGRKELAIAVALARRIHSAVPPLVEVMRRGIGVA
jgi:hypothetical protein